MMAEEVMLYSKGTKMIIMFYLSGLYRDIAPGRERDRDRKTEKDRDRETETDLL